MVLGSAASRFLDTRIADRNLGKYDRVDNQAKPVGQVGKRLRRPSKPTSVLAHDVEKNIAVDQDRSHSFTAGQRHDCVSTHGNVAAPPQMGNQPGPPAVLAAGARTHDPNHRTVELEIDLGVGQQTRSRADFRRDGHLSFRGYTHS
jgi:hypothetical protein